MNAALGNVGKTVFYTDPIEVNWVNHRRSLQDLVSDLDAGRVELLVMIGGNPAYNTPADLSLLERLKKPAHEAPLRIHLSEYKDETSLLCHWHIPQAHYLESWGDTRSYDGTVTILQPLIEPLFDGKTAHELLAVFSDQYDRKPIDIVKQYWQQNQGQAAGAGNNRGRSSGRSRSRQAQGSRQEQAARRFETKWRQALHDGFIPDTALPTRTLSAQSNVPQQTSAQSQQPGIEVIFRPDPSIYDGRFANNGWLQELPKPLDKGYVGQRHSHQPEYRSTTLWRARQRRQQGWSRTLCSYS